MTAFRRRTSAVSMMSWLVAPKWTDFACGSPTAARSCLTNSGTITPSRASPSASFVPIRLERPAGFGDPARQLPRRSARPSPPPRQGPPRRAASRRVRPRWRRTLPPPRRRRGPAEAGCGSVVVIMDLASDGFEGDGNALPDADAHGGERALLASESCSSSAAVPAMRAPDMPSGWPSAMAPPFGFTCSASSGMPSSRSTAMPWLAKASFSSIDVEIRRLEAEPRAELLASPGAGPMPMMRGATPAAAPPRMRAMGSSPYFLSRLLGGDDQGRRAVIDAGGIAGRHRAVLAERRRQLRQLLQRGVGAGMLVLVDDDRIALALRDRDRHDLLGEPSVGLRRRRLLLRAQGEGVLVLARDVEVRGHVLAGLRHGIDAVLLLHQRVDEAPADGGVVDLGIAREGRRRPSASRRARATWIRRRRRS